MNQLIQTALVTLIKDECLKKFGTTRMIDPITISICLTFFDCAEFRITKVGINDTSLYGGTSVPGRITFSNSKCYNRTKMNDLMTDKGTVYICDKEYIDYDKFDTYL